MLVVTLIVAPENWMNMTDKEPDYREIWNSKKGKRKKKRLNPKLAEEENNKY